MASKGSAATELQYVQVEQSKAGSDTITFHPLSVHELVRTSDAAPEELQDTANAADKRYTTRRTRAHASAPSGAPGGLGADFEAVFEDERQNSASCQEPSSSSPPKKRGRPRKNAPKQKGARAGRQLEHAFAHPAQSQTSSSNGKTNGSTNGSRYNIYEYTEGERKHNFDLKKSRPDFEELERSWLTQMEDDVEDFVRISTRPRQSKRFVHQLTKMCPYRRLKLQLCNNDR